MADKTSGSQGSDSPPPSAPTDEQVVQSLIGSETKGDPAVTELVNRLVGANEFTNQNRPTRSPRRDG